MDEWILGNSGVVLSRLTRWRTWWLIVFYFPGTVLCATLFEYSLVTLEKRLVRKTSSRKKISVMVSLAPSGGDITPFQQVLASGSGALITSFLGESSLFNVAKTAWLMTKENNVGLNHRMQGQSFP